MATPRKGSSMGQVAAQGKREKFPKGPVSAAHKDQPFPVR